MTHPTTVLIGTTKGAFILRSQDRGTWDMTGPRCDGWSINHVFGIGDQLWAGGGGEWEGAGVWRSTDGGETWTLAQLSKGQRDAWFESDPDMAAQFGWTPTDVPFDDVAAVWSLHAVGDTLYAGTKPAQLLESHDGGATWQMNPAFRDYPERDAWNPGAAGLTLHTIVPDPHDARKMWLGVSAAGVFATEDGGLTWDRRNRLSNAEACGHHDHPAAPRDGETGHCVHNMHRAAGETDLLYQQNHHGVWRSTDGGRSWDDINTGLPSTFGFPIAVHPRDGQMVWTIPLNGDSAGRYPPGASAAVWKSTDSGETWAAKQDGLPTQNCYFTVLRQAMSVDQADSVGVYFGTNTGSIFASLDEGETWEEIARHLPTVLSVETLR
ncbi:MAG: exo-alpha-sialidase [Pseudomonadota bacterium]